ncbi:MAG: class I SAM-dependent methyltransferase [Bacilli bacterium]|nr:class I SAM-dependent methyltransferase [Bacilli bacterium]
MDKENTNEALIRFWDSAIRMNEESKEELRKAEDLDYRELAPSKKLLDAIYELRSCRRVLDYGCGNGWASIAAIKCGCPKVQAVDMGKGIIDSVSFFADLFGVKDSLEATLITPDWLSKVPDNSFDGLICSNVLDVVPLETCKEIIQECARILQKDAKAVIGLNFYMSPEAAKARGVELVEGRYLFVDGILRLSSRKDEEWEELFAPYFEILKLDHFAWPNEEKESRRLFLLRRK